MIGFHLVIHSCVILSPQLFRFKSWRILRKRFKMLQHKIHVRKRQSPCSHYLFARAQSFAKNENVMTLAIATNELPSREKCLSWDQLLTLGTG